MHRDSQTKGRRDVIYLMKYQWLWVTFRTPLKGSLLINHHCWSFCKIELPEGFLQINITTKHLVKITLFRLRSQS